MENIIEFVSFVIFSTPGFYFLCVWAVCLVILGAAISIWAFRNKL